MDHLVSEPSLDAIEIAKEGPLKHFWTVDLQVRLDVTRRLVKSLAALAIPDSLRRQRWVPATPGGQHADR